MLDLHFPATWPGQWCSEVWALGLVGRTTEGAAGDCILDGGSALQIDTHLPQVGEACAPLLTFFRPVHGQRLLQQSAASFISSRCIRTLNT